MTTTAQPTRAAATIAGPGPAIRIRVVAGALVTAALTIAALLLTTPWGDRLDSSADDILDYDAVRAVRDGAWVGLLVDGFAVAVVGLTLGLVTCHLLRGRGRVAALVGAVLSTAGGILFAMGSLAFGTVVWFASNLSEAAGRTLVDFANDHPGHLVGATMAGFFVYTVGTLTLATALFRARAVPVVALLAYVLLVVAQFTPLPGRALDFIQVAIMALLVTLGVTVLRRPGSPLGGGEVAAA